MAFWWSTEENVLPGIAADAPRVLLVENDPELRGRIAQVLAPDFEILTARNGREGLERALESPVELIVTNLTLPDMSGEELVAELRSRPGLGALPILVLAAPAEDALRARLLREGLQDYVVKPFLVEEVLMRARNLVGLHRAQVLLWRELAPQSGQPGDPREDLVSLAREVAARKRDLQQTLRAEQVARQELRRSEERLQAILDAAPAVIYVKDLDGRLLVVNRAFEELVELSRDRVIGKRDHELSPPELADAYRANDLRVVRENAPIEREETARFRGESRLFRSLKFPLRDETGTPYAVCGISTDITEQKRSEEERRRVAEFQDRLIGIVSHDIRSPVTALQTSALQLLRKPDMTDTFRRPLQRIVRCGERIEQLIRVLVDFTRAGLGEGLPIFPRPADFHQACRSGVEAARAIHPDARLCFEVEGDGAGSWDPERLAQVATSLVDNALRYGAPGGEVHIRTRGEGDQMMLEVHNRGDPIAPAQLSRLFEPFERGRRDESTVSLSLGLGLFLVRAIARAHRGTVEVESSADAGTTFRLRLPRNIPAPAVTTPVFT